MDIGVQSLRNLSWIPGKNTCLWFGLALSSLPLHLVYVYANREMDLKLTLSHRYNATIFQTTTAYNYDVFMGSEPFSSLESGSVRPPNFTHESRLVETSFNRLLDTGVSGELERINPSECISHYDTGIQSIYGSLLLVTDDYNSTMTDYDVVCHVTETGHNPILAVYFNLCPIAAYDTAEGVAEFRHRVEYCLAEKLPQKCTVEYSLPLAIFIIVVNVVKAAILCWTAVILKEAPILITGDAVASFTKRPDPNTRALCLLSRDLVLDPGRERWKFSSSPKRTGSAVSVPLWIACLSLSVLPLFYIRVIYHLN